MSGDESERLERALELYADAIAVLETIAGDGCGVYNPVTKSGHCHTIENKLDWCWSCLAREYLDKMETK